MQYNWKYRKYRNGKKVSSNFDDLVTSRVHSKLDSTMWYPYTKTQTPFREISLEPFERTPEFTTFLRTLASTPPRLDRIWSEFKQSIYENWMPDKIHVIGASSGYDSRLIAKAIQELTRYHGTDWLGETYFVECAGEAEGFTEIMKALKFKNYIIWNSDYSFEFFENHSDRYNGLCAYPMNQWYDFYIKNWNQEDIQYISGYGGNVADVINLRSPYMANSKHTFNLKGRLNLYFQRQYYYQISAFKQPKYSFHPFWSWRYIRAVSGVNHDLARTSVLLANTFVPECNDVKRMHILKEVTDNGHRTISRHVVRKLHNWYRETPYGKCYPCDPSNKIEYNKWWLMFCIASYAEKNNISINRCWARA